MNTTHTPGPWNVGSADGFNACTIFQEGPKHEQTYICSVYGIPINTRIEEVGSKWERGMANARLIAAAPELLEALQLIRDYVVTLKGTGHDYQLTIDAAIAKATGEGDS